MHARGQVVKAMFYERAGSLEDFANAGAAENLWCDFSHGHRDNVRPASVIDFVDSNQVRYEEVISREIVKRAVSVADISITLWPMRLARTVE
ncbi:MAG: hypothetical protein C4K49_05075 [Candidatus Thorarchaeota archaeon]|nr:MAG: hypothetical protein C4K49_05075 [Candidatus Thorarchaeota archaeon]